MLIVAHYQMTIDFNLQNILAAESTSEIKGTYE